MIAEKTGHTVAELEESLSVSEFYEWSAFFELRRKAEEKAMKQAKAKGRRR